MFKEESSTGHSIFHMFVSRISGHCGLNAWKSNSEIIQASSLDPVGPYIYNQTVVPIFSHGASVRRLPDEADGSGYLMMHLGCGEAFTPYLQGCTNGTTPPSGVGLTLQSSSCTQFNVTLRTAPGLSGPWSDGQPVELIGGFNDTAQWWVTTQQRGFTNPAPHVDEGGNLLLAYRADASSGGERVSVGYSQNVAGPYEDNRTTSAVEDGAEDPYLWRDERGHWHMLMHSGTDGVAAHAFSRDSYSWTRSQVEPYTAQVEFAGGRVETMSRRERPQLLLDETGRPCLFSSGVEDYDDHSYTLVMEVKK
eukprot:CAMPEP_0185745988 /NCGR_PEP_ID=MMETSP1174-20130828/4379_1 /TAXON_ID=35687 /ORGANISM="Dictyocha speculum, Strain CCMP1381" /LENGTH=306 /DNA_ID=CAMNT_0028420311 /DNA_START=26 /DNA_END=946 /DNA_ORIENTATION=-